MAISRVQALAGASGASMSLTNGVAQGNSVAVGIGAYSFTGTAQITSSSPTLGGTAYSNPIKLVEKLSPFTTGSGVVYFAWWLLPNIPVGMVGQKTLGITVGGGGTAHGIYGAEYGGLGASPALDEPASAGVGNGLNPIVGPSPATQFSPDLVLGAGIMLGVALGSPGAPWQAVAGPSNFAWAGDQIATSSGQQFTWSQNSGGSQNAWSAVIASAAATGSGGGPVYNNAGLMMAGIV